MHQDLKIVLIVLASDPTTLDSVLQQAAKFSPTIDAYEVWTTDISAEQQLTEVCSKHSVFLRTAPSYNTLYHTACDPDTVYLKLAEDVMLVDSQDNLLKLLDFRIDNPGYFLVVAAIANNPVVSHLQQQQGTLTREHGPVGYHYRDNVGYKSVELAHHTHRLVEDRGADSLHLKGNHIMFHYERMDLDACCWLGREFGLFGGFVPVDDDEYLSSIKPQALSRPNIIFANFLVVKLGPNASITRDNRAELLRPYHTGDTPPPPPPEKTMQTKETEVPSLVAAEGEWWTPDDEDDETVQLVLMDMTELVVTEPQKTEEELGESKSEAVPEESKSEAVPEESKSEATPVEKSKSEAVPEESKSDAVPEESKSEAVPEESKSEAVPVEKSKSEAVPEESKSEAVPVEKSKSEAVPEESKSEAVPEAPPAPTPKKAVRGRPRTTRRVAKV